MRLTDGIKSKISNTLTSFEADLHRRKFLDFPDVTATQLLLGCEPGVQNLFDLMDPKKSVLSSHAANKLAGTTVSTLPFHIALLGMDLTVVRHHPEYTSMPPGMITHRAAPPSHEGASCYGAVVTIVLRATGDEVLPNFGYSSYSAPQFNDRNRGFVIKKGHPFYDMLEPWAKGVVKLQEECAALSATGLLIDRYCNTAGQVKRMVPALEPLMPGSVQRALEASSKASPVPVRLTDKLDKQQVRSVLRMMDEACSYAAVSAIAPIEYDHIALKRMDNIGVEPIRRMRYYDC